MLRTVRPKILSLMSMAFSKVNGEILAASCLTGSLSVVKIPTKPLGSAIPWLTRCAGTWIADLSAMWSWSRSPKCLA